MLVYIAIALNNQINDLTAAENNDILMVTETWFSEASVPNIKGYDIFRKDRSYHARGVCIYSESSLFMSDFTNAKFNDHQVEQVWYTFTNASKRFVVGCISASTIRH